jgi:hypothetical protein
MKACEALIAWSPNYGPEFAAASPGWPKTPGEVAVGPLLKEGDPDWTKQYAFTGGAAEVSRRHLKGDESALMLFIDFHTLVVRDGVDPQKAHKAFLAIDEYRHRMSRDTPGAE